MSGNANKGIAIAIAVQNHGNPIIDLCSSHQTGGRSERYDSRFHKLEQLCLPLLKFSGIRHVRETLTQ